MWVWNHIGHIDLRCDLNQFWQVIFHKGSGPSHTYLILAQSSFFQVSLPWPTLQPLPPKIQVKFTYIMFSWEGILLPLVPMSFNFLNFICLFTLGCAGSFLLHRLSAVVLSGGYSLVAGHRLSLRCLLSLESTGSVNVAHGVSCSWHVGSSQIRYWTHCHLHWQPLSHQRTPWHLLLFVIIWLISVSLLNYKMFKDRNCVFFCWTFFPSILFGINLLFKK